MLNIELINHKPMKEGKRTPYYTPEEIPQKGDVLRQSSSHCAQFKKAMFEKYASIIGTRVLDCGTGHDGLEFLEGKHEDREWYGFDIVDVRRKKIGEFAELDASFEKLPWPDSFFDAATAWCIFPHLENPHNLIREINRVLKPNGILLAYFPHIGSLHVKKIFFKTGDLLRYADDNNHISIFTPAIYRKTVLKYFDELAVEYEIDEKIYKNRFGWIKKMGVERNWPRFPRWFGKSLTYVLKKKSS